MKESSAEETREDSRDETVSDYDPFAWFYERYWTTEVPPEILTVIESLLLPLLPEGAQILDLCCGTGFTLAELHERGYRLTGLDASKEMLRHARRRKTGAKLIRGDARSFKLPPTHHAVISTFDSLNHIMSLEELTAVFRNVYGALSSGGLFFFDLNMEAGFIENWADYYAIVEEDHVCVLRGEYDRASKLGRYDITMFRRSASTWRRDDAVVLERCYSLREIKRALKCAGFNRISTFDAETELGLTEHVGRRFFLAIKEENSS